MVAGWGVLEIMYFKEFIQRYNDGSIVEDASWRAYDIAGMATHGQSLKAAKELLGGKHPKDHAFARIAAEYGLPNVNNAYYMATVWYVWNTIATGSRKGHLILRQSVA